MTGKMTVSYARTAGCALMAEFYVTYREHGQKHLAIVVAVAAPPSWKFESLDDLQQAMNVLDNEWELIGPIFVHESLGNSDRWDQWQQEAATFREQRQLPKPDVYFGGMEPFA